jgi:hypothetical protein
MRKPLLRSLVSSVLAACFTLSVMAWGTMSECPAQAMGAGGHGSAHAPMHSGGHRGQAPGAQGCSVHLCCAHLSPQAQVSLALRRTSTLVADAGFAAVSTAAPRRPAHSLPFAHAPPHRTV